MLHKYAQGAAPGHSNMRPNDSKPLWKSGNSNTCSRMVVSQVRWLKPTLVALGKRSALGLKYTPSKQQPCRLEHDAPPPPDFQCDTNGPFTGIHTWQVRRHLSGPDVPQNRRQRTSEMWVRHQQLWKNWRNWHKFKIQIPRQQESVERWLSRWHLHSSSVCDRISELKSENASYLWLWSAPWSRSCPGTRWPRRCNWQTGGCWWAPARCGRWASRPPGSAPLHRLST